MAKEELIKDWFSDRDGHFVLGASGHVSFEDTLESEESLAEVFAAKKFESTEDLLKECYHIADETIISMNTPFKVKINVSSTYSSGTDSNVVNIATNYFNDEKLTPGEKANVFVGTTVHEACHLLYTDFSCRAKNNIAQMFANIIEDERIERCLREHRPGLMGIIGKCKEYLLSPEMAKKVDKEKESKINRFINLFLSIIRYPKDLDMDEIDEFEKYLVKTKEILTPYPTSTRESVNAGEKMLEVVKDIIEDEKKEKEEKDKGEKKEEKGDGESKSESTSSSSSDESSEESKSTPSSGDGEEGEGKDSSSSEGEEEDSGEEEDEDEGSSPMDDLEKAEKEMEEKMKKIFGDTGGPKSYLNKNDRCETKDRMMLDVIDGTVQRGKGVNVFFRKSYRNVDEYNKSLGRVRSLIPSVSRQITGFSQSRDLLFTGLRSGKLDTHRLSQAVQGVENVYSQKFTQTVSSIAVCIVVDQSGSMGIGKREKTARDTAILIYEALKDNKQIETYIYGHTANMCNIDGKVNPVLEGCFKTSTTDIYAYKEKGTKFDKAMLGSISAMFENFDGIAISEIAKRVRRQTDLPCIMFVISDGEPIYGGKTGIETGKIHTKKVVEEITKDNFYPIQICMTEDQKPETMFKHYVKFSDLNQFPHELGKLVKHQLLSKMKSKIV